MRLKLLLPLMALAVFAAPAHAGVFLGTVDGSDPYAGPPVTYNFESPAPITGGTVTTGSNGIHAQPFGSTGNYWTVGPDEGSPGFLDLSSFAALNQVSFIWGSVDAYNTLNVLDRMGGILKSFTGADASAMPDGTRNTAQNNPLATLVFTGADQNNIGGLQFLSTTNAFETDNFSVLAATTQIGGVPEPTTWAMMLMGFGMVGFGLRRRKDTNPRLRTALA